MAPHIIHNPEELGPFPCKFCLGSNCKIYVKRRRGAKESLFIDADRSTCPNLVSLSLKDWKVKNKSSKRPPITNKPLICPLCGISAPAVWKYNLKAHLEQIHGLKSNMLKTHNHLYHISKEELIEVKSLNEKRKKSGTTARKLQQVTGPSFSDPHTIQVPTARYIFNSSACNNTDLPLLRKCYSSGNCTRL